MEELERCIYCNRWRQLVTTLLRVACSGCLRSVFITWTEVAASVRGSCFHCWGLKHVAFALMRYHFGSYSACKEFSMLEAIHELFLSLYQEHNSRPYAVSWSMQVGQ